MSEPRDLAEAHVRAFNERAWQRAADIYAPDIEVVEPGGTSAATHWQLQEALAVEGSNELVASTYGPPISTDLNSMELSLDATPAGAPSSQLFSSPEYFVSVSLDL